MSAPTTPLVVLLGLALAAGAGQGAAAEPAPTTASESDGIEAPTGIPPVPGKAGLERIPVPDMAPLEQDVIHQIRQAQQVVAEELARPLATDQQLAGTYATLGQLYQAYGLLDPAKAAYRNARRLAPSDMRWPYLLGRIAQDEGRLQDALRDYRATEGLYRGFLACAVNRGQVYLQLGRADAAWEAFAEALATDPSSAAALAGMGEALVAGRAPAQAVDYFKRALERAPQANRLYYQLGMAYRAMGDKASAQKALSKSGEIGVKVADPLMDKLDTLVIGAHVNLLQGHDLYRAGRYVDAAAAFAKALTADPDSCEAAVNLATALATGGETAKAIEQFRATSTKCPDNPTAHYDLGHLLVLQGRYAEARTELEAALALRPRDLDAHMELAAALWGLSDLPGAIDHLHTVVHHDTANEEAQYRLAATLVRAGRYQEARSALEDARRVLPTAGRLAHALARLLAAAPDPRVRDGARALELARRVYDAQQTVSHGQTLAMALAENGECEDAAKLEGKLANALESDGGLGMLQAARARQQRYAAGAPCREPVQVP